MNTTPLSHLGSPRYLRRSEVGRSGQPRSALTSSFMGVVPARPGGQSVLNATGVCPDNPSALYVVTLISQTHVWTRTTDVGSDSRPRGGRTRVH